MSSWKVVIDPIHPTAEVRTEDDVLVATAYGGRPHAVRTAALIANAPRLRERLERCCEIFELISDNTSGDLKEIADGMLPSMRNVLDNIDNSEPFA